MADNGGIGTETNVSAADREQLAATPHENQRPARPKARRRSYVQVQEEVVRPLNDHYQKLDGYIRGFLLFRRLAADSTKIRSALQDPNRWKDKWQLLEEVRGNLEGIQGEFDVREIWKVDFADELMEFACALRDAQLFLNAEDGPFFEADPDQRQTSARLIGPINKMIMNANKIEGRCRTKSGDEIAYLGQYVNDIFGKLRKKPAAEPSDWNKPFGLPARGEAEAQPVPEFRPVDTEDTNVAVRRARREAASG